MGFLFWFMKKNAVLLICHRANIQRKEMGVFLHSDGGRLYLVMKVKKLTAVLAASALSTAPCIGYVMAEGTIQTSPKNEGNAQQKADDTAASQENPDAGKTETENADSANQAGTDSGTKGSQNTESAENSEGTDASAENSDEKDSADSKENTDAKKTKKDKKGKMHANPVDSTQKYAVIALVAGVVIAVAKIIIGVNNHRP